jgi:hypothetical protein
LPVLEGPQKIKAPTHRPQKKKKEEGKGGFWEHCCAAMQGPARAPSSTAAVSRLSGKWGLGLAFMGVYHIHGRHPTSVFFFGQPHLLAPPMLYHTCARLCWRGKVVISPSQAPKVKRAHQARTAVLRLSLKSSSVIVSRHRYAGHDLVAAYLSRFSIHFSFRPTVLAIACCSVPPPRTAQSSPWIRATFIPQAIPATPAVSAELRAR